MRKLIQLAVLVGVLAVLLVSLLLSGDISPWIKKHDTPIRLTSQPWNPNSPFGEAMVGTGDALYVVAEQSGTRYFWKYDPTTDTWGSLTSFPDTVRFKNGTALAWDYERYIYALFGGAYRDGEERDYFFRFDTQSGDWERLRDTPSEYQQGAGDAITFAEYSGKRYLYAFIGQSESHPYTHFARYDIEQDIWETMNCPPFWTTSAGNCKTDDGASLVWTGGRYIYALRGEYDETRPNGDFARYDIEENKWLPMKDIPEATYSTPEGYCGVGDGASLLWIGSWLPEHADYIYALGGGCATGEVSHVERPMGNFYYYRISTDEWGELPDAPCPVGEFNGSRLGFAGGHIHFWQGGVRLSDAGNWVCQDGEAGGDNLYMFLFPDPWRGD
jgi:hypothetical protein